MTDTEGAADAPVATDAPVTKLSPKDRRKRITDRVPAEGPVTIEDLVQELGVSQVTVHRVLDTLEHQVWPRKVRGGATATPGALFESTARWRGKEQVAAKEAVCAAALAVAEPGQAVITGDSGTALPLARTLSSRGAYTVIANSLQVINEPAEKPDIRVIALGDEYHAAFNAFLGMSTADIARSFRADIAFLSTSAVDNATATTRRRRTSWSSGRRWPPPGARSCSWTTPSSAVRRSTNWRHWPTSISSSPMNSFPRRSRTRFNPWGCVTSWRRKGVGGDEC